MVYRGVAPEFSEIKRWYVDEGAIFSQYDVDRASDVCVVGRTVPGQLFGVEDPAGKVIRVNNLQWAHDCLITHEHDIAQFAKRVLVFRDGKIRSDTVVGTRPKAAEVLKALPTLED